MIGLPFDEGRVRADRFQEAVESSAACWRAKRLHTTATTTRSTRTRRRPSRFRIRCQCSLAAAARG